MDASRWLVGSAVLTWATALCAVDLKCRRLPNVLTLPGAALILAGAAIYGQGTPALLGGLALAGLYLVVHLMDPTAMGGGDVKLALGLGALTGAFGMPVWLVAAIGAPVITAVGGAAVILGRPRGAPRSTAVPHGPSMCAASLVTMALAVF